MSVFTPKQTGVFLLAAIPRLNKSTLVGTDVQSNSACLVLALFRPTALSVNAAVDTGEGRPTSSTANPFTRVGTGDGRQEDPGRSVLSRYSQNNGDDFTTKA